MRKERTTWLAALALAGLVVTDGCAPGRNENTSGKTSTAGCTAPPAVTIFQDKDGRAKVDGAPLHGDPKVCAAFKKCCASPDLGLMCGLTQASENGDCAKALAAVKAYAQESRSPGCK